jgi:carbamoyl-phosphate synthase large subunit
MKSNPVRVFCAQSLTPDATDRKLIQGVLDLLDPGRADVLTGRRAHSAATFEQAFSDETGHPFYASSYRNHRLALLDEAEAMLVIRTGPSESCAFETAYNVLRRRIPMLVAAHDDAPVEAPVLHDLQYVLPTTRYVTFRDPADLRGPLRTFLTDATATAGTLTAAR